MINTEKELIIPEFSKKIGVYLLLLFNDKNIKITIGSLGVIEFLHGYYIYIGSAFGKGGLSSRLKRHINIKKKIFWHIDYLLDQKSCLLTNIIELITNDKIECKITNMLLNVNYKFNRVPKFGSSDCSCESHLLFNENKIEKNQILKFVEAYPGINTIRNHTLIKL